MARSDMVEKGVTRPDSVLIERCLRGDQTAWAALIDRYQRLIYSVASSLSRSAEDTADVFQQVCLELYKRLPHLRDTETLPAWLITVTRRQATAVLKSHKALVPLNDQQPDIESRIHSIEKEYLVDTALLELPERCRQLIDLLYLHPSRLSYADVAAHLKMPVSSIGPTRARCLEKLRKLLR
jgi:RNA polymerase sigma factor (sigma-70 family)